MTKRTINDGKYYEKKTHNIISRLNPSKEALPDVRIKGKLSESSRQLDVILRDPGEYDFIAFECKDEKNPVGTPTVEAYYTKLMDVGAKKGAIVSNSRFSRGAQKMANKLKINLLHLVDTGDEAIKTKLLAPSAVVHERVERWGLSFAERPPDGFPFDTPDYRELVLQFPDGQIKNVKQLASDMWVELGESVTNGTVNKEFEGLTFRTGGKVIALPLLTISLEINFEYRYGSMDITQSQGLYHVVDGAYQTSSLAIGPFGVDIFKSWTPIPKEELAKLKPSVVMHTRTDLLSSNS